MDGIKYFLKFGERAHIQQFVNGSLYCSNAVTFWGIEAKNKIRGQGDILEAGGKFFSQNMVLINNETKEATRINQKTTGLFHFEPVELMPVFCLFAVGNEDCIIDDDGNVKINLSDSTKQTIRTHFPKADTVAIINDPDNFIREIKASIGYEIQCGKVNYFNIDKGFSINNGDNTAFDLSFMKYLCQDVPPITENGKTTYRILEDYAFRILFCKDNFFIKEQEYRIVLPKEKINVGTQYPIEINQKIEVVPLDDFLR